MARNIRGQLGTIGGNRKEWDGNNGNQRAAVDSRGQQGLKGANSEDQGTIGNNRGH